MPNPERVAAERIAKEEEQMRHDWQYFSDNTARCRRCGMHIVSAGTFIENRKRSCHPASESKFPEPQMTTEEFPE